MPSWITSVYVNTGPIQGFFPVAIEDYGPDDVIRLTTVAETNEERTLPLPPPGSASQELF